MKYLKENQIESIVLYLKEFLNIEPLEQFSIKNGKIISEEIYNEIVARQGLKFLLNEKVIKDFKEVTIYILKIQNVLIPCNVLEDFIAGKE